MAGVIILVRGTHSGFDYVLTHLGRSVPNDWEDRIKKIHSSNRQSTIIGILFLIAGIIFQIEGILIECFPLIFGCNLT